MTASTKNNPQQPKFYVRDWVQCPPQGPYYIPDPGRELFSNIRKIGNVWLTLASYAIPARYQIGACELPESYSEEEYGVFVKGFMDTEPTTPETWNQIESYLKKCASPPDFMEAPKEAEPNKKSRITMLLDCIDHFPKHATSADGIKSHSNIVG